MPNRRKKHAQNARAVLLWAVLIYTTFQLTAGVLFDYAWPLVRFPSAAYRLGQLAEQPAPPDVVTLGSSRFGAGIVPHEMSALLNGECQPSRPIRIFNASVPAGDAISAEFLLHQLMERGVQPRLVLMEVSPETLNRANEWLGIHVRRQLRWHEAAGVFADLCRSFQVVRWAGERANPIFSHREALWQEASEVLARLSGEAPPCSAPTWEDLLGYNLHGGNDAATAAAARPAWSELLRLPQRLATPKALEISRNTVNTPRHMLRSYHIDGGHPAAALERLLSTCRQRDIAVILVGIPVTTLHRAEYTPAIDGEYQTFIARLTRDYGCRFVDYRDRVPDCLFVDVHHLSREGGTYFSRLLTHDLLVPFCGDHDSVRALRRGHEEPSDR